jgi:hypothetical protein
MSRIPRKFCDQQNRYGINLFRRDVGESVIGHLRHVYGPESAYSVLKEEEEERYEPVSILQLLPRLAGTSSQGSVEL